MFNVYSIAGTAVKKKQALDWVGVRCAAAVHKLSFNFTIL